MVNGCGRAAATDACPRREFFNSKGSDVKPKRIYKGYIIADVSTPTDNGRYRARVAIMALDGERTRSQRFLDLETFPTEAEAKEQADVAAIAWIDHASEPEQLNLPTNFSPLDFRG